MKECELCEKPARMYCESDQASLCWECDTRVHGANFLVARHTRSLLCRGCQAPTPWRASGTRLGQTVSVCDRCAGAEFAGVKRNGSDAERDGAAVECGEEDNDEDDEDDEEEEDDDDDEDEEEEEEEEEDGDNQVVPGTMTPPPVASSSSSDDSSTRVRGGILKRMRESTDLAPHQDDLDCSSSQPRARSSPDDGATSLRPSKDRKTAALAGDTHHHLLDLRSRRPSSSRPI
ncbi:hypothetical protein J5N97_016828 [Dioscorea zingiberensis]|uniref:B box-type domain-containing protein n=1 Tax=Dioscorea zingiberensis TaxID=325984 RepID=A0A9D5CK72_9LILI|nr:hypothetical protein J5N97_016828 [Dioscorea zingiberensis]